MNMVIHQTESTEFDGVGCISVRKSANETLKKEFLVTIGLKEKLFIMASPH
jgi:hypothetical protein